MRPLVFLAFCLAALASSQEFPKYEEVWSNLLKTKCDAHKSSEFLEYDEKLKELFNMMYTFAEGINDQDAFDAAEKKMFKTIAEWVEKKWSGKENATKKFPVTVSNLCLKSIVEGEQKSEPFTSLQSSTEKPLREIENDEILKKISMKTEDRSFWETIVSALLSPFLADYELQAALSALGLDGGALLKRLLEKRERLIKCSALHKSLWKIQQLKVGDVSLRGKRTWFELKLKKNETLLKKLVKAPRSALADLAARGVYRLIAAIWLLSTPMIIFKEAHRLGTAIEFNIAWLTFLVPFAIAATICLQERFLCLPRSLTNYFEMTFAEHWCPLKSIFAFIATFALAFLAPGPAPIWGCVWLCLACLVDACFRQGDNEKGKTVSWGLCDLCTGFERTGFWFHVESPRWLRAKFIQGRDAVSFCNCFAGLLGLATLAAVLYATLLRETHATAPVAYATLF